MRIYSVWGVRKYFPNEPELMLAWDEFSVDSNPEGYEAAVKQAIESWGDDLLAHRVIEIEVFDLAVLQAFKPAKIKGGVSRVQP